MSEITICRSPPSVLSKYDSFSVELDWIFIGERKPPINVPFLATTHYGVEKVVFDGKNYIGYSSCHCCRTNGCEIQYFDYWMPMPKPYRPHEEFGKHVVLKEEGKDA